MQIVDFTAAHIEQATQIAKQNYEAERRHVPALPPINKAPDLTAFAENGLGVAAFEGDTMLGFLCCVSPFENAFRSTDARGVFSPMGANGAIGDNRAKIYARLYQAAGEKWAGAGASSHAVCLYAHDKEAQEQFYRYGFGMRTVDAIRGINEIAAPSCDGYVLSGLIPEEIIDIMPLDNKLHEHLLESPLFMYRAHHGEADFLEYWARNKPTCFTAKHEGQIVAYILAEVDGETFIKDTSGYCHISAAYCLPKHRGKGLPQNLLNLAAQNLKAQGYTRLGVDFESINPAAYGFWPKYFEAYTCGVVRRIDEYAIKIRCST